MRFFCGFLALLAMHSAAILAQAPAAPASAGSYGISGTVVSAGSGAPLNGAEVTLTTDGENGTQVAEVVTGESGGFQFGGLAAGKYAVQASHRGYIMGGYEDHEGYFTAVVTGPGLESRGIRLALMPYGAIDGVVLEDGGGPVPGAQVALFRQDETQGESRIVNAGQEITDDSGSYEFSQLRPGIYYVDVSATPWYAFHAPPKADDNGGSQGDGQPAPLDVAFPLTFYPNATDSASATPIPLAAGDHAAINFSLHAVPAIHLQIRVPVPGGPRRGVATPMIAQQVFGTQQMEGTPISMFNRSDNTIVFDYSSLAPGQYVVEEGGRGEMPVDLAANRTIDAANAGTGADVTGKLANLSGGALPDGLMVWLHPVTGAPERTSARVERDGTFTMHEVAPGTYTMQLGADSGAPVVVQMAASGAEVHGNRVTVGSDAVLLAATISSGSATVNGFAKRGGKGVGGTMVVLVPDDANASVEMFRRDQSDSDGSFSLPNVVPGKYMLVAIDNGWGLEWAKREVMARYLAHGMKVDVPANAKTMELPDGLAVQDR